jgi:hypothetical protein
MRIGAKIGGLSPCHAIVYCLLSRSIRSPPPTFTISARRAYEKPASRIQTRHLPAERNRPVPWVTGGDFTAYARDRLFREVVAFAGAQGGTLVLEIEETKDKPRVLRLSSHSHAPTISRRECKMLHAPA